MRDRMIAEGKALLAADKLRVLVGREAYEADCARRPYYPDGTPRKTWDQLGEVERWSWLRAPSVN